MASPDHQVGALFEALDKGVLMVPSNSIGYFFAISSCPEVRWRGTTCRILLASPKTGLPRISNYYRHLVLIDSERLSFASSV